MCKVTIDAFDSEESAVAFIDWLKTKMDNGKVVLFTTNGVKAILWDGVDTSGSNKTLKVVNIVEDTFEDSDED